jgi:hypothetical protein
MGNKKEKKIGTEGMKREIKNGSNNKETIKIIFLSSECSGKTTLFNQIKHYVSINYNKNKEEYSKDELDYYKRVIYSNICLGLIKIQKICFEKKIKIKEESKVKNIFFFNI